MPTFLGQTCENADGFRTVAFHSQRGAHDVTSNLAKAKCDLLTAFGNYLEMKERLAGCRASAIAADPQAPGMQLLVSANLLLAGYEHDLAAVEGTLRAAEKVMEDYDTNRAIGGFNAELVSNFRELVGLLRRQAQDRLDLIDLGLLQDIGTQYAALNIVA